MRRRKFIALSVGAAVSWPLALRAQQSGQMRRIGVLMPFARDNPETQARITAFVQGLQKLGWTEGRNLQIEYRWGTGDLQKAAATDCYRICGRIESRSDRYRRPVDNQ